jgi:hypothetical protein
LLVKHIAARDTHASHQLRPVGLSALASGVSSEAWGG